MKSLFTSNIGPWLLGVVLLAGCAAEEPVGQSAWIDPQEPKTLDWNQFSSDADLPEHVAGQIVVSGQKLQVISPTFLQKLSSDGFVSGLAVQRVLSKSGQPHQLATVSLKSSASILDVIKRYSNKDVIVEPNFIFKHQAISNPNDYFYDPTKDLPGTNIDAIWGTFKVNARMAWKFDVLGAGIRVAVVDTGVGTHSDLNGNIFSNAGEIANNGLDDDNNGFIDDVRGWNFVAGTNNTNDDHGHGTHVSGTIGTIGDNTIGMPGIAPSAKVVPVKVLAANGSGTLDNVALGIAYGASFADVINLSLGGPVSATVDNAVINAVNGGTVVVVAAGNSNQNTANFSPARVGVAVTVAATDVNDAKASFSNFGAAVDVAAPGVSILSTLANGINVDPNILLTDGNANRYIFISGTSMAAPHVAGLAALILSLEPMLSPADVQTLIRNGAKDLGTPGFDEFFGMGRIQVNGSIGIMLAPGNQPPKITAPASVSATVGKKVEFTIDVSDPENDEILLSVESLPDGATFDASTGRVSWTPQSDQVGSTTIKAMATDEIESTEKSIEISVGQSLSQSETGISNGDSSVGSLGCAASVQDTASVLGFVVILLVTILGTRKKSLL